MSVKVHISPEKTWEFYRENKRRLLEEMVKIAENTDNGFAVYITDEDSAALFSVCKGCGDPIFEKQASCPAESASVARDCYEKYIKSCPATSEASDPDLDDIDIEEMIEERESELIGAMQDFLITVFDTEDSLVAFSDVCEEDFATGVLEHVLRHLALDLGLPVYRPQILSGISGKASLVNYPYNED